MVYIYVLKLECKKYYVGKTKSLKRLDSHFDHSGSEWTKKYKPIKVIQVIPNCDDYDEDKWTLKYMNKKGINNVRGGIYCSLILSNNDYNTIQRQIRGSQNLCYKCGSDTHFANNCDTICMRCHRTSHTIDKCYAKKYEDGTLIANEQDTNEQSQREGEQTQKNTPIKKSQEHFRLHKEREEQFMKDVKKVLVAPFCFFKKLFK